VSLKWTAVISQTGWQYFRWIDVFLSDLEAEFSFEHFLEEIGWETAKTIAVISERVPSSVNSIKKRLRTKAPVRTNQRV
jgi:hypothetical protein